jgi:hypothetical protein
MHFRPQQPVDMARCIAASPVSLLSWRLHPSVRPVGYSGCIERAQHALREAKETMHKTFDPNIRRLVTAIDGL